MKLETHTGQIAGPVTAEIIARTVAQLTEVGEAYIILSDDVSQEDYVQAAGTVAEGFIIERRDGCAGGHYRGDRRVSAAMLTAMLVGYLNGPAIWTHVVSWHRVRVDFGASKARAWST